MFFTKMSMLIKGRCSHLFKKENDPLKDGKAEIPLSTPLNPEYGLTAEFNQYNPLQAASYYSGDSVDEHVTQEEANEFLAEKEISQNHNNL
jgi:hypothetical protein